AFLSGKGCIHRDLAARNVLVSDRKTVKVNDFGLCRLMDNSLLPCYTTRGGRLPIKWMALESLQRNEFSEATDVWSYGVLLWEMWTLGESPYNWLEPCEMIEYLTSGRRLAKPSLADPHIYTQMQSCWSVTSTERPTF
ncbi:unnamed protein product, partial [Sphagnum balticum]